MIRRVSPQIKATTKIGLKYGNFRAVPWLDWGPIPMGALDNLLRKKFL